MPKADLSLIGKKRGPEVFAYTWKDVVLYALGVGAQGDDLAYVYEGNPGGLKVLPTFAVVAAARVFPLGRGDVQWSLFLHGEQRIRWFNPFPTEGRLLQQSQITGIYDKGKGALYQITISGGLEDGTPVYEGQWSIFYLGAGGFGGDPGPQEEPSRPPAGRKPDFSLTQKVPGNQAALYRLCGDVNPLHIDPAAAAVGGFDRPILHGLCTYGFAARIFLDQALAGDVSRLKEFKARFSKSVYPGDELTVEGWKCSDRYVLEARTPSGVVLTNAYALVSP